MDDQRVHQQHNIVMQWLSPTNFLAQQSDFIETKQEGTGQWFLDSDIFANWLHEPSATLFCPGTPGAGKTVMAAIVIDHLCKRVKSDTIGVAYIYCDRKAQIGQTAANLLAAILKQLLQDRPSLAEPLADYAKQKTELSLEQVFSALQIVLLSYSTVYVVVDALNECPNIYHNYTRSQFLAKLRDLQKRTNMHLLITSRHDKRDVFGFSNVPTLEVRASEDDVKRFVAGQIHLLPSSVRRDPVPVQNKIAEAANGMFLFARLAVDLLRGRHTKAAVNRILGELSQPSKLRELLDRGLLTYKEEWY